MNVPIEQSFDASQRGWISYEKQLRALIENSTESVSLLSAEGVILYTSPVTERMLGYPLNEFIGRNAFELLHPDDAEEGARLLARLLAESGEKVQARFRFRHKEGSWRWLEGVGTNLLHDENFLALVVNFRDITDELAASETLQKRIAYDQALLQLAKKLELAQEYPQVLEAAQETVQTILGYQNVWVYLSKGNDELALLTSIGDVTANIDPDFQTLRISGDKFLEEIWQSQDTHVIVDAQTDPRTDKQIVSRLGNRTIINTPMVLQGRLLGFLGTGTFGDEGIRPPTSDQVEFFASAANRIAAAISRIQLLQEIEQRMQFTIMLNSMARIALEATDLQTMLYQLVERLAHLFRADACYLTLWDETRQMPVPTVAFGPLRESYPQVRPHPGEATLTEVVLQAEHGLAIEDTRNSPFISPRLASIFPNPCVLALPLIAGRQKLGAVILAYNQPRSFPVSVIIQAEQAAAQIALAIAKTDLITAERKRREEAETLREATSILAASFDLDQILETLLAFLKRVVPYDSACVFLREDQMIHAMAVSGHPHQELILGQKFPSASDQLQPEIFQTGRPLILMDAQSDPRFLQWGQTDYVRGWMGIPMWARGEIIGILTVDSKEPGAYTPADAALAQAFANQAAIAIDNARLLEGERRRRIESETLHQVTKAFTGILELGQVLQLILSHLQQVIPYDSVHISMIEQNQLKVVAHSGFRLQSQSLISLKIDDLPHIQEIIQKRYPVIIADTYADPRWIRFPDLEYIHCWMGVPLVVKDQVIGILHLDKATPNFYLQEHASLAMTFANQAAIAISNAQLLESERRRRTEAETLRELASTLSESLDLQQVLNNLLASLQRVVPYDSACVFLREGELVHAVAGSGLPMPELVIGKRFSLANNLLQPVIYRTKQPLILEDAQATPGFLKWGHTDYVRGWMGIPLAVRGQIIGVLTIDNRQPGAYTWNEAHLAQSFANQAAVAIENARLFTETLRRQSELASLLSIAQTVSSSLDLRQVLEQVALSMAHLINVPWSAISIYDPTTNTLRAEVEYIAPGEFSNEYATRQYHLEDYPFTAQVLQKNEPCVIRLSDPQADPAEIQILTELEVACAILLPLVAGGRTVGLAELYSDDETREFSPEDIRLLQALADQAAVAIANAQLFSETRQRLSELEAMNRISKGLRTAASLEDMLPTLMDETLFLLDAKAGEIWLYNLMTQRLYQKAARGWFNTLKPTELKPGEGIAGMVFQSGKIYQTQDFASDPNTLKLYREQLPPNWGGGCVPLRAGQEVIGVFFVSVETPRMLTSQEIHLLETISEIAGSAIHRARLNEMIQHQLQRLLALRAIDSAISASLDLRLILNLLLEHVLSELQVDAACVLLAEPHTYRLEFAAGRGFHTTSFQQVILPFGDGLAGQVASQQTALTIPDLTALEAYRHSKMAQQEGFVFYTGVPLIAKGQVKGVLEVFQRSAFFAPPDWLDFLDALSAQAAIAIDSAQIFADLQRSNVNLTLAYDNTLEGWVRMLDLRDKETEGHTQRVTETTLNLARALNIPEKDLIHIKRGALLHDIGKMALPDRILLKPGPLNDEEWEIMRQHPQIAFEMLSPIPFLRPALDIPYCHHEKWDGTGYPRQLRAQQIPLSARIFSLADVWDALTHDRPYRKAWSHEKTRAYLLSESGKAFDPDILTVFLQMLETQ
ncbi:MAG: hypothetical protein Fur0022_21960 [Anaerolineales bacterium]